MRITRGGLLKSSDAAGAFQTVTDKQNGFGALMGVLRAGVEDAAWCHLGDSTGVGSSRFVQLTAQWLAAQFPKYTVQIKNWNDTSQAYDAASVIQTGTAGAPRYLSFAATSHSAMTPDGSFTLASGDIDVRIKCRSDWTSLGTGRNLVSLWGGLAGARAFIAKLKATGFMSFQWSTDGTNVAFDQQSTAAPTLPSSSTWVWLRWTLQVNVAGQWKTTYYTSADYDPEAGTGTWTQIGSAWTNNSGVTSIAAPTTWYYEIGAQGGNAAFAHDVAWVEVRDGVNGPVVTSSLPTLYTAFLDGVTRSGAPVLTVLNGSRLGADIAYLSNSTRLPKMTPHGYGIRAISLATSHNDTYVRGAQWLPTWDSWLSAIRARHPYAGVTPIVENPRTSPASYIDAHDARRHDLLMWARRNSLDVVDIYRAFVADGRTMAGTLVDVDGIHPTDAAGSPLWASTVEGILSRA